MIVQFISAISISVAATNDGHRPGDVPPWPLIVLQFSQRAFPELVTELLIPTARPEHALTGYYRHPDGKMTLGTYLVIPVTEPRPMTFVLGNEIDFSEASWQRFEERFREFGRFSISCGPHLGLTGQAALSNPHWFLECREIHRQPIMPMVYARLTT